jgi:hypothetical protein
VRTFGRIVTAVLTLGCLVGTILFLVFGPRLVSIALGALAILFGIMTYHDIRSWLRERDQR